MFAKFQWNEKNKNVFSKFNDLNFLYCWLEIKRNSKLFKLGSDVDWSNISLFQDFILQMRSYWTFYLSPISFIFSFFTSFLVLEHFLLFELYQVHISLQFFFSAYVAIVSAQWVIKHLLRIQNMKSMNILLWWLPKNQLKVILLVNIRVILANLIDPIFSKTFVRRLRNRCDDYKFVRRCEWRKFGSFSKTSSFALSKLYSCASSNKFQNVLRC